MRTQALVAVGLLTVILRETVKLGRIRSPQNGLGQISAMALPTATSIPLCLMTDVPSPFSPSATLELASCHLAKMASPDFLEDGEWAGFYSSSYPLGQSYDFDPPMYGIRFHAIENSDGPTALDLYGTGKDGIGTFDLYGNLAPGTGQFILNKCIQVALPNGIGPA